MDTMILRKELQSPQPYGKLETILKVALGSIENMMEGM
jgi:hypothetical protein